MKIVIGSDHAGFELKETCKGFLEDSGEHGLLDVGVFSRASSDYPQIAHKVAQAVADGDYEPTEELRKESLRQSRNYLRQYIAGGQ